MKLGLLLVALAMSHLITVNPFRAETDGGSLNVQVERTISKGDRGRRSYSDGYDSGRRHTARKHEAVCIEAVTGYHYPVLGYDGSLKSVRRPL